MRAFYSLDMIRQGWERVEGSVASLLPVPWQRLKREKGVVLCGFADLGGCIPAAA